MYFTKSVRNVKIAFLYIMKQIKILSYKGTTLNFARSLFTHQGKKLKKLVTTRNILCKGLTTAKS